MHEHWTINDWNRIIWSDETEINRFGSDGRLWCWKWKGEVLSDRTIQPTVKHGGSSVMVWGCMTAHGVGYLSRIDGRLDAKLYCKILEDELMQTLEYYEMEKDATIFQQDNDPKHTSRQAKTFLQDLDICLLQWPPQSPDLNPIEHLGCTEKEAFVLSKTTSRNPWIMGKDWKKWNEISKEECQALIASMPRRIHAVLKAKRRNTKYWGLGKTTVRMSLVYEDTFISQTVVSSASKSWHDI